MIAGEHGDMSLADLLEDPSNFNDSDEESIQDDDGDLGYPARPSTPTKLRWHGRRFRPPPPLRRSLAASSTQGLRSCSPRRRADVSWTAGRTGPRWTVSPATWRLCPNHGPAPPNKRQ